MNYFNGSHSIEVKELDTLLNMSQDTANLLAIGPQEDFMNKLDNVNRQLRLNQIEEINVTKLWNWRPGSYDKIKELINKLLYLNKKSNGMDSLLYRTYDRMNYLNYIKRQAREMEFERDKLKRLGVSQDVNIDVFKENCIAFVNDIKSKQDTVSKLTNGKVVINSYLDFSNNTHNQAFIYFDIIMKDLTMNIYQGRKENSKCIQELSLEPINIIIQCNFRHLFNGMKQSAILNGRYMHPNDINNESTRHQYSFPYISATYGRYGNVCLDSYRDEIHKHIKNKDLVNLSMSLLTWAQYYNTSFANPYTQPNYLFLGLPEGLSKEFISTIGEDTVLNNCPSRAWNLIDAPDRRKNRFDTERYSEFLTQCNNANCSLREKCKSYIQNCNFVNKLEDLEYIYKCESIAGWLLEQFNIKSEKLCETRENVNLDIKACDLSYYFEGLTGVNIPNHNFDLQFEGITEEEFSLLYTIILDSLINWIINMDFDSFQSVLNIYYDYGYYYWDKEKVKVDCKDESKMERLMKQWASSSERSVF